MADISVTLVLDDSQYTGKLNQITQNTTKFGDEAKKAADKAKSSFEEVNKGLESINSKFEGLTSAIVGVGIAEFIKSIMELGLQTTEMAEKFGISTQAMLEINQAAANAGISSEAAAKSMSKLMIAAQEAANGNQQLRNALSAVGVSQDYLRTHDASETLMKTVDAISAMKDPAQQAYLSQQLLGRAMNAASLKTYADQLHETAGTQAENAEAAEQAAQTMIKLRAFMEDVKIEVMGMIAPFLDFKDGMIDAKTVAEALVVAISGFVIIKTITTLWAGLTEVVEASRLVFKGFSMILGVIEAEAAPVIAAIAAMVAGAVSLYVAYEVATGKVSSFGQGLVELGKDLAGAVSTGWEKLKTLVGLDTDALDKNTEATKKNNEAKKAPQGTPVSSKGWPDMNAKAEAALQAQISLQNMNKDLALQRLDLELQLVGSSDDERKSRLAAFDATTKYYNEVASITKRIAELQAEDKTGKTQPHTVEIAMLTQQLSLLKNQKDAVEAKTKAIVSGQEANKFDVELLKLQAEAQQKLNDLKLTYSEYTMTSDEKELANVQKIYEARVKSLKDTAVSTYGPNWQQNTDAVAKYNEGIQQADASMKQLKDQTQANIDQSRNFATAWDKSIKQFNEDSTNGAKAADTIFKDMTSGIENAFTNFAKTGKLSFSDLMSTMTEDFIKFEVRMMESQVFKMLGGDASSGGSMLSGFAKMLGFANGGIIPTNGPVLVGENGPELLTGAAGMNVVPNSQLEQGGGDTHIHNYNIQAVDAKSVSQLFSDHRMTMFGLVEQARRELPMRTR